jgi:metal-dependent HD superfamily phosphatase/phosphodiesterase
VVYWKSANKEDIIMKTKFEEVTDDIIDRIFKISYEDKDKEMIKSIIMYNIYQMTRSEDTFEKSIQTLKLSNIKNKNE